MTSPTRLLWQPDREQQDNGVPRDAYGAGYMIASLATDFHALCCLIGPDEARKEMAEIINNEFGGRYRRHQDA